MRCGRIATLYLFGNRTNSLTSILLPHMNQIAYALRHGTSDLRQVVSFDNERLELDLPCFLHSPNQTTFVVDLRCAKSRAALT